MGSIVFDGTTQTAVANVTVNFLMGAVGGNPVFDLRQTAEEAFLDGTGIAVSQLAHHDFGGGTNAELRILDSVLSAGSARTLRLR